MMKRSVRVVPSIAAELYNDETHSSGTCHILRDDLYLPIFPFSNEEQYLKVTVIRGDKGSVKRAIATAFDQERESGRADRALVSFMRSAAQTAVYYGDVSYEIVFERDTRRRLRAGTSEPVASDDLWFRVDPIMSNTVFRSFGRTLQRIPPVDADADGGERVIVLDPKRTFTVDLPNISRRRWWAIMASLAAIDRASLSAELFQKPGFDFSVQQDLVAKAQLFVTSPIPWVQRASLKSEAISEFYYVYKWLQKQRFIFELRERITAVVTAIIRCAGETRGFEASLSVEGLQTTVEADQAIADLVAGRVDLSTAIKRMNVP